MNAKIPDLKEEEIAAKIMLEFFYLELVACDWLRLDPGSLASEQPVVSTIHLQHKHHHLLRGNGVCIAIMLVQRLAQHSLRQRMTMLPSHTIPGDC